MPLVSENNPACLLFMTVTVGAQVLHMVTINIIIISIIIVKTFLWGVIS